MCQIQKTNDAEQVHRLLNLLRNEIASHGSRCASELGHAIDESDTSSCQLLSTTVPGCTCLPDAIASIDEPLQDTLREAVDYLTWRIPGFGHLPAELSDRMAVSVIMGPDGMILDESVSLGIILLAPGVHYPSHSHAAEELYLVLAGTLDWALDGVALGSMRAGDFIHHEPWQHHSMNNGDTPALLFWGWTGDISGKSYSIKDTSMG